MSPPLDLSILRHMLTYCRPSGSLVETLFIHRFIVPLGADKDAFGNWHVMVDDSPILWSSHTDTVHRQSEYQTIHTNGGIIGLSKRSRKRADCLGADDTAGVFLMTEMIKYGVPGHYIFHHGEEIGGIGSSDLAIYCGNLFADIKYAIALDRKGTTDVITHQMGRCCSDDFALSLATQLNKGGLAYAPSDRGLFTDTANYTEVIGECTNVSVGYEHCHSPRETLDTNHLQRLFTALCALDQSALIASRDPHDDDWGYDTPPLSYLTYLDPHYQDVQTALRRLR